MVTAGQMAAIARREHIKTSMKYDGTNWDTCIASFDALIKTSPIGIIVHMSRGFHEMYMRTTGQSPWSWDECICDVMHVENFREGFMALIRIQVSHPTKGFGHLDPRKGIIVLWTKLFDKVLDMMQWMCNWLVRYPDASEAMADRAMCLLSDMHPAPHFDQQIHLVYTTDDETWLTLTCWHDDDADDAMPFFVYMESAPGSNIQSLPKLMKNRDRLIACDAACAHLASNGFMLYGQPLTELTTFEHDSFDETIRRPMVRAIAVVEASGIPLDEVDIVVTHHVGDPFLDEFD